MFYTNAIIKIVINNQKIISTLAFTSYFPRVENLIKLYTITSQQKHCFETDLDKIKSPLIECLFYSKII